MTCDPCYEADHSLSLPAQHADWWLLVFPGDATIDSGTIQFAICPGPTFEDAVDAAWSAACNPGGAVFGFPAENVPKPDYRMTLFTKVTEDFFE